MEFSTSRDGKELVRSGFQPRSLTSQKDWRVINVATGFRVSDRMAPGIYRLRVTIADASSATATELSEFEVVS